MTMTIVARRPTSYCNLPMYHSYAGSSGKDVTERQAEYLQQREVINQRLTNYRNNHSLSCTSDQSHRPTDREGYRVGSSADDY